MASEKGTTGQPLVLTDGRGQSARQPKKSRKFFNDIQPTFTVPTPTTKLDFLDHSDPAKDKIVRKKAREYVNRNKEASKRRTSPGSDSSSGNTRDLQIVLQNDDARRRKGLLREAHAGIKPRLEPVIDISAKRFDPFETLPAVGRPVDHIIEFFLTSCPEEVPCSDDKYAWRSQQGVIPSRNNSVLGAMVDERVSFVLWLHATTMIRDAILGTWGSEECLYYYQLSLEEVKKATMRRVEDFTDEFLSSLACFTATANFSGQWEAAEMHRDAMVKAVTLKGGGDIINGLKQCKPFTQKAMAWCEFHVAAQIREKPKFPRMIMMPIEKVSPLVVEDAKRLTKVTLSKLPSKVSAPLLRIILQLHELSLAIDIAACTDAKPFVQPNLDPSVSRNLYDAEYSMIEILAAQKDNRTGVFSLTDVLLAETCQMYIWTALRMLPPVMMMCSLFVTRLKAALLPFLGTFQDTNGAAVLIARPSSGAFSTSTISYRKSSHTDAEKGKDFLIWALFLGNFVASVGPRPEYDWFREQLRTQIWARGNIIREDDLRILLEQFPCTDALYNMAIGIVDIDWAVN